jgi:three-Cys-motif partner protein
VVIIGEKHMSDYADDFFEGKRPWSHIKDEVLSNYMQPYLAKVNKRGHPILLIDGYAGPGIFEDGTFGSPLIICKTAETYARGNYHAFFINKDKKHHEKLYRALRQRGWLGSAQPLLGDTRLRLQQIYRTFKDQTVFLYLDPFGPSGCDFALLKPLLDRDTDFSTEIMLTMNVPGIHRLASRHTEEGGRKDEETIRSNRDKLTKTFGGDYWKDIINQGIDAEEREIQLITAYQEKLVSYSFFTGACPVRDKTDRRIKYFIIFASRHRHAVLLLNDIMAKAYFARMHEADYAGTLWEDVDWREMRSIDKPPLDRVIIEAVTKHPGETRKDLWFRIVEKHFMRYLEPEYKDTVQRLVDERKLISPTPRKTKRLNDNCALYPP